MGTILLALVFVIIVLLAWLTSKPESKRTRIILSVGATLSVSVLVAITAYPLGTHYGRIKAYQGEREIREFFEDLRTDLASNKATVAKKKIEYILENWETTDFIERDEKYGTWIGDQIDIASSIENETEIE